MILRVGSRKSALAVAQASAAAREIVALCPEIDDFEIVGITTKGDVDRAPLAKIGGTGLFTSAVREALLAGECDIAIHSAKDLPARDHPDLTIIYPKRANPADVVCAHVPFAELPKGAKVGTGSPRRAAQLRAIRPDLRVEQIRGNVQTRLARIDQDLDAVILARAGLDRLGLRVGEDLPAMVPAAAQGALGIEVVSTSPLVDILMRVDDAGTRMEVTAERAFMAALGAGCTTPVGALAKAGLAGAGSISLHARYIGESLSVDLERTGTDPVALATELAAEFSRRGVGEGDDAQ